MTGTPRPGDGPTGRPDAGGEPPAVAGGTVPLGDKWRLWSRFALRGPGFPVSGVLRLAPEGLAEAADAFTPDTPLDGPAWDAFADTFAHAAVENANRLQDIAADPAFRTAVAWQNRTLLRTGITPFLARTPTTTNRSSMPRQREELVAHYWQRFCVKNDTIGFFGPVGWGRIDPGVPGLTVRPGDALTARTGVYFSSWSIDALAKALDADPRMRAHTAPRRIPYLRLTGTTVTLPGRPPQPVTPLEAEVLGLCDGRRSALAVGEALAPRVPARETEAVLEALLAKRWITWRLEVPAGTFPEESLRSFLRGVPDPAVRDPALAALDRLEEGRERVRAARGDAELTEALGALEACFAGLTEAAATRQKAAGTAPGRALVYSDCERAATADAGAAVLAALAPLDLLMTSAVWLTSRVAARVLERVEQVWERLAARGGEVDLAAFWFACMPVLHGDAVTGARAAQEEFQRRWADILRVPAGAREVRRSCAGLEARVREEFGDRGSGWTAARYLSPDVMIAATGAEAVARGEFGLVLGELHLASNTLGASLFVHQHPDPDELFAQTGRDHPGPRLMPLLPKEHRARLSVRVRNSLVREEDYQIALLDGAAGPVRPRTYASADVAVERLGGRLVVRLPDGAVFGVLDVFAHALTTLVMDLCKPLPEADHTPRVTVDKMVLARETWRFTAQTTTFAQEKNEARRFVRARHWQAQHDLPRHVFVVSPTEPRPFYVDFHSPVYLNILAKALRRLTTHDPHATLTISEMLPTPDQTWLTDHHGNRYTSELRFVAVDRSAVPDGGA